MAAAATMEEEGEERFACLIAIMFDVQRPDVGVAPAFSSRETPSSTMRTLFDSKIKGPSLSQEEDSDDPNSLPLPSSSQASSSQQSQDSWLTLRLQQASLGHATSYTHGDPPPPPSRRRGNPKLVIMGMRRCGKSSVQKVIFEKMAPPDSLYLEPTYQIQQATMQSSMHFESTEVPTQLPVLSPEYDHSTIFSNIGAAVWIIDSQDEYLTSISELLRVAIFLAEHYPRVNLEVFIHKTDGLSEEYKYDTFREVRQRVQDELSDYGYGHRSISYYQTSIFDHSIFEAMSKVVQKLLPQLPAMETLLTKLCATCRIQKAYLFDTISKIYIATDASPTALKDYEVCSDYIDVIVDIKQLYGWHEKSPGGDGGAEDGGPVTGSVAASFVGESLVTLDKTGETYIYAREVSESLSLVCLMSKGSTVDKRVVVDYNVDVFVDAMQKIFSL